MTTFWTIIGMAVGVYAVRLSGFALAETSLPRGLERALTFVPVAMLAALSVSTLIATPAEVPIRLVAAIGAGFVVWRTRKSWACILVGMALYWLLGRVF
jgi:branched-subunit amino acid transport protein